MSVRSMMGALSLFPSNDASSEKERGRSWSKKDKLSGRASSVQDDSVTESRASSRSRSSSPFVFRRSRTRDPSPAVGALRTDADSDYEPSTRIRTRNAFSAPLDDETSGDETEGYDDSEESWSDVDPITERNTETNAALISPTVNEEGTYADPLGEGVNVVIPQEPYFPSTLNDSNRQPRRRKSTKAHFHDRLPVTTSRPVFQRDRCSIKIVQGDPEAALEKRRGRTYTLLSDLSEESRYALEWGIGTVIRDGDELYVIPAALSQLDPQPAPQELL